MHRRIWLLLILLCVLISGCAAEPPLNFSLSNVKASPHKINGDLKSVTVTLASPDEKKGDIPSRAQDLVPPLWQTSLVDALNRASIFIDDSTSKLNLAVKILALNVPSFGASFTTTTIARYDLINRATGSVVYSKEITAQGTVPGNYAFLGAIRAKESVNRSVQNNISTFISDIESSDTNSFLVAPKDVTTKK